MSLQGETRGRVLREHNVDDNRTSGGFPFAEATDSGSPYPEPCTQVPLINQAE